MLLFSEPRGWRLQSWIKWSLRQCHFNPCPEQGQNVDGFTTAHKWVHWLVYTIRLKASFNKCEMSVMLVTYHVFHSTFCCLIILECAFHVLMFPFNRRVRVLLHSSSSSMMRSCFMKVIEGSWRTILEKMWTFKERLSDCCGEARKGLQNHHQRNNKVPQGQCLPKAKLQKNSSRTIRCGFISPIWLSSRLFA